MHNLSVMPVFYDPRMVAEGADSFSPSARKPREVVASWKQRCFPMEFLPVTPVSAQQLALAHDADYVSGVLACWRAASITGSTIPVPLSPRPCHSPVAQCSVQLHMWSASALPSPARPAPAFTMRNGGTVGAIARSAA